ncbi:endo-1,3(4)-beta-glucanase [Metschnikowia aff. pulcherrima]|uniref:glucan endo-1,3-beta-D-glucosidase n=1 Tax=Metschnikowia aff. pulcherrima TaxID=2163413 RepID=A0A4V1ADH8_9ASCO|nr:endo-1,3(4)-beta-glucanase [Metschnikowia aff. pulcherrima]
MISKLILGLAMGLLLSGQAYSQAVRDLAKVEGALSVSTNITGFQDVIDQVEDKSVQHTAGLRVVVVYEQPTDCPVNAGQAVATNLETFYTTITTTTDVLVTKVPDNCLNDACELQVETVQVTTTFTTFADSAATGLSKENVDLGSGRSNSGDNRAKNSGSANSGLTGGSLPENSDTGKSTPGKASSGDSRSESSSVRGSGSKGSDSQVLSGEKKDQASNQNNGKGSSHREESGGIVVAGNLAVNIVASLGFASTKTIFTDAATSSVEYESMPTPVSMTQANPLYTLVPVSGPDAIVVHEWSFSASATAGMEFRGISGSIATGEAELVNSAPGVNGSTNTLVAESAQPIPKSVVFQSQAMCVSADDLFAPISDTDPSLFFGKEDTHPFVILPGVSKDLPFQTNNFYTNLFTGNQDKAAYVWPYIVKWEKESKFGLSVQYTNPSRRTFGGETSSGGNKFYFNAINVPGVSIGADSIKQGQNYMTVSQMKLMSVNVKISPEASQAENYIEFPLVEGMGVVTSIYHGLLFARIEGNGGISNFTEIEYESKDTLKKLYRIVVGTGETWLVLVKIPESHSSFELKEGDDKTFLIGSEPVNGLIVQVALAPSEEEEESQALYYKIAGQHVTDAKVSGSMDCGTARYKIAYETANSSDTPLIFALDHHLRLFDGEMEKRAANIKMESTTKGMMYGYLTKELLFSHGVDTNVQWLPYLKNKKTDLEYSMEQIELIREAATEELRNVSVIEVMMNEDTQYFTGKVVDKYAYMMYALHDIVKDDKLAELLLAALKEFFKAYKAHGMKTNLFYDTKLGGVTSSALKDIKADFRNGFYSGHNIHYGYIIHAAALVGYVDSLKGGTWAQENKDFINMLVRDVANPSEEDKYFPVSRTFDWFHGHSWTGSLVVVDDGKDFSSSSEDVHFSYAMKMWGKVIKDASMEARGDLMLSIQTESLDLYFLYRDGNLVVPSTIASNKVAGILFENKIDYTTFFGDSPEEKHGVQMIPMTPALGLVRSSEFAEQEWNQILHNVQTDERTEKWRGVLNANRVFFDPAAAWEYFTNPAFDLNRDMDGGQSKAWALAFTAPFVNAANGGVN